MEPTSLSFSLSVAAVIGGLIMLVGGGESLIGGATRLARHLGMKPLLIGLTVVAFGTSVPELFVSLTAAIQGYPDIMIGNVVGSNIANVGLILGCSALLATLRLTIQEVWIELLLVTCGSIILMFCSGYGMFPRPVGVLFIVTLVSYTVFTCLGSFTGKNRQESSEEPGKKMGLPLMLALIFFGLLLLAGGSNLFIKGAVDIARHFGVSELIIGLTLAAIGTSLPELASSLSALRHNESGLLIGNIIGSNMFNLFMVLGLTGAIKPFTLSPELLHRDLPVMLAFTLILIPILHRNGGTRRWHGLLFLGAYAAYMYSLI
ncbi:MAG: calcium/sodium antiporter [Desulfobulbaceae bacterium]|nr:calcium/sodium antiporter [Desulfobulbaceae bacterium]